MADARGRGLNRGRGRWHALTPNQMAAPRRVERLSDYGWEDRGEERPDGKAVFNLGDFAKIWRGNPGQMPWQGEVLVEGKWKPFSAAGQFAHMTARVREAARQTQPES